MQSIHNKNLIQIFDENLKIFVQWKFIPGRGPVPVAGRGERAAIRKSGKSFKTAVNESAAKEKKKRQEGKKSSDIKTAPKSTATELDTTGPFKSTGNPDTWVKKSGMTDSHSKLADSEIDSLRDYENGEFVADIGAGVTNTFLRDGKILDFDGVPRSSKEKLGERVNSLTDAINKSEIPENIVVHRAARDMDFKVGEVFTDNGFMSTTASKSFANEFLAGTGKPGAVKNEIEIRIPKGAKAIEMFSKGNRVNGDRLGPRSLLRKEKEILVQRGSSFNVISVTSTGRKSNKVVLELFKQDISTTPAQFLEHKSRSNKKFKVSQKARYLNYVWNPKDIEVTKRV